ncbi:LLM class flavin-dependent oxidoreductase [Sanguibacter sp. A247]|uniref:LLM class flavin-dependent oxidoreductase n=1 Tax=unclassified Sanguibacter TaxID=2645534 RepID=UPI003FD8D985
MSTSTNSTNPTRRASTERTRIHLALDLTGAGARRFASHLPVPAPVGAFNADRLADLVRTAQRGTLDFVAVGDDFRLQPETIGLLRGRLDAAVITSRLGRVTDRLGLVATISPESNEPGHVATALQTISRNSGGRAGWQVDGSTPDRLVTAVTRQVSSIAPTVISVRNPAHLERAGRLADVVRIGAHTVDDAFEQRRVVRDAALAAGRDANDVLVLVDLFAVTGPDRASAQARLELLDAFEGAEVVAAHSDSIIQVGTPSDLADLAEDWHAAGAVDGFVVAPSSLVADVTGLVDGVVPVLRSKGLFREDYPGATLRESLGLASTTRTFASTGR